MDLKADNNNCITNYRLALLALFLLLPLLPQKAHGRQNGFDLYYTRFEVALQDGVVVESRLEMIPVQNEFRTIRFQKVRVTGYADGNATPDAMSAARHDAIQKVLTTYGLKSVSSRAQTINTVSRDVVLMSYEGVVRYPFQEIRNTYLEDESLVQVDMAIAFTPLAFPTEWRFLLWRHRIKQAFNSLLFLFR